MNCHTEALGRTALLINREFFGGQADQARISDALLDTGVTIRSNKEALQTRAGQTALITAFILISRLGLGIKVDVPEVEVIDRAPPLRRSGLRTALLDLGADLVPDTRSGCDLATTRATFSLGVDSRSDSDIAVSVDQFGFSMECGATSASCEGDRPFGGLAAGAGMAAVALEVALPAIEAACGQDARTPRPSAGPPLQMNLCELFPGLALPLDLHLGDIDVISGGAITNALIYCLLRIPGIQANFRVIEADLAELSNINRYMLLRRSQLGASKIKLLERSSLGGIHIRGVDSLFTPESQSEILPFAPKVLVGADDVRARWWVQETEPQWLAIGATGDHLAQVTTHLPGTPCAGCLHPVPLPPQEIPTISFISFWAGLLQASALLCPPKQPVNITAFPFALGGPMPFVATTPVTAPQCPLGCGGGQVAA